MQILFCEKMLKISQKVHGGDRKHIKMYVKKNKQTNVLKSTGELFFTPTPTLIVHISK